MPCAHRRCAPPLALPVTEACLHSPRAGCGPQELDVTKKTALCTSSVAYQGGRKPQFQIKYDLVVRALPYTTFGYASPPVHTYRTLLWSSTRSAVLWCAA